MAYPIYPSNVVFALPTGVPCPSLVAAVATTSPSQAYAVIPTRPHLLVIASGTGTLSAGVVTVEEASAPDYAGTWSAIQTIQATSVSGGAQLAVHVYAQMAAVRARVSTLITGGGSVNVDFTSGP